MPAHAGGEIIWSEAKLEAMDYALLCAYTHPDCYGRAAQPGHRLVRLGLLLRRPLPGDVQANPGHRGRQDLSRRAARVHAAATAPITAEPTNPVRPAWPTCGHAPCPPMSQEWRVRFAESTRNLLDESLWELANINEGRVANPVEYIEMRRKVGGAPWSANLVEYAADAEVPAVRRRAPGRCACCATPSPTACTCATTSSPTSARWRRRARLTNGVLVLETFLGCTTQEAAEAVNDLLTSRLQQFEHTALTEVPVLCDEHGLAPDERRPSRSYVQGLQDWQSGGHEWHMRSSRYMNAAADRPSHRAGFPAAVRVRHHHSALGSARPRRGGSAVSPTSPHRDVGGLPCCPTSTCRSRSRSARIWTAHARRLVRLGAERWACSARASGTSGSWPPTTWRSARPASTPTPPPEELDLGVQWLTWGTYGDDYYPLLPSARHATWPAAGARHAQARDVHAARPAATCRCRPTRWSAAWPTCGCAPRARCRRPARAFRRAVDVMLESWLWELAQPGAEPHPRPRRLHRDAPPHVRLRPDDEPGPARPGPT